MLCDLTQPEAVLAALRAHLGRWQIKLTGVACFDCESMPLAAQLARAFALPYPSADAVAACRSKFLCKRCWQQAGLPTPRTELVRDVSEALHFMGRVGGPVVLKPMTGSGSELVFRCDTADACASAFRTMQSRLAEHPDVRMYAAPSALPTTADPHRVFVIEEFIQGAEYSCDFLLDGDRAEIIRVAQKIAARDSAFGTTLAYVVPGDLPPQMEREALREQVRRAAQAVGLRRAIGMLDFIVRGEQAVMIEMAPRPGGDCLPPLLLRSSGFDILGATLDLAESRPVVIPPLSRWGRVVGLRLFATQTGIVRAIHLEAVQADPRVLECHLKHGPGHAVVLPPLDWDSRVLGHVLFEPSSPERIEAECLELAAKVRIDMEAPCD
jgi:biotin carboxylase